jgi:hypothetical protein
MIFDAYNFYILDLDAMDLMADYPLFFDKGSVSWVYKLPNANFLVLYINPEQMMILDFFSKMWENPFRWLFLAFLDKNSAFCGLPRDILCQIWHTSHPACYIR